MTYSEGNGRSSKWQSWREERRKQKRRKRRRQSKQQQPNSPFRTRNPKHPAAEKDSEYSCNQQQQKQNRPVYNQGQQTQNKQSLQPNKDKKPDNHKDKKSGGDGRRRWLSAPEASPIGGGGRLSSFSHCWKPVTSDPWVLQTVASGYRLEFTSFPHQCWSWTTTLPKDTDKRSELTEEIKQLIRKIAIERVHPQ